MILESPFVKNEKRTAINIILDREVPADDMARILPDLTAALTQAVNEAIAKLTTVSVKIKAVTITVPVATTPARPESETTPQPGYVPPVPHPPGR